MPLPSKSLLSTLKARPSAPLPLHSSIIPPGAHSYPNSPRLTVADIPPLPSTPVTVLPASQSLPAFAPIPLPSPRLTPAIQPEPQFSTTPTASPRSVHFDLVPSKLGPAPLPDASDATRNVPDTELLISSITEHVDTTFSEISPPPERTASRVSLPSSDTSSRPDPGKTSIPPMPKDKGTLYACPNSSSSLEVEVDSSNDRCSTDENDPHSVAWSITPPTPEKLVKVAKAKRSWADEPNLVSTSASANVTSNVKSKTPPNDKSVDKPKAPSPTPREPKKKQPGPSATSKNIDGASRDVRLTSSASTHLPTTDTLVAETSTKPPPSPSSTSTPAKVEPPSSVNQEGKDGPFGNAGNGQHIGKRVNFGNSAQVGGRLCFWSKTAVAETLHR